MDRNDQVSPGYRRGVVDFLNVANQEKNRKNNQYMTCPRVDCNNENMNTHSYDLSRMHKGSHMLDHVWRETAVNIGDEASDHQKEEWHEDDMFVPSPLGGDRLDVLVRNHTH
uniref:Transposase-associated domain-containing protein n=1 Tax=Oryza punctata TaxID=4537 RepID=A0A0E0LK35_ORYPU